MGNVKNDKMKKSENPKPITFEKIMRGLRKSFLKDSLQT